MPLSKKRNKERMKAARLHIKLVQPSDTIMQPKPLKPVIALDVKSRSYFKEMQLKRYGEPIEVEIPEEEY